MNPQDPYLYISIYHCVSFSFIGSHGIESSCLAWTSLSVDKKVETLKYAHARGAIILASVGGAEEKPYALDPDKFGAAAADFSNTNLLDGVDFDLENIKIGVFS